MKKNNYVTPEFLAVYFYNTIFADSEEDRIDTMQEADMDFVGDNPYDTLHINGYFFSMSSVYDIVMRGYSSDTVLAWYDYCLYHLGKEEGYYLNINGFAGLYDGTDIKVWSDWYKSYRDEQEKRNNLKSEKERQEKEMKEIYKKAEEEIKKHLENPI